MILVLSEFQDALPETCEPPLPYCPYSGYLQRLPAQCNPLLPDQAVKVLS